MVEFLYDLRNRETAAPNKKLHASHKTPFGSSPKNAGDLMTNAYIKHRFAKLDEEISYATQMQPS